MAAAGIITVGGLAAVGGGFSNPEAAPLPEGVTVVTQQVYDVAYAKFEPCMKAGGAALSALRDVGGSTLRWERSTKRRRRTDGHG